MYTIVYALDTHGHLLSTPVNIARTVGSQCASHCRTSSETEGILWYLIAPGTTVPQQVYSGKHVSANFVLTHSISSSPNAPGQFDLLINSVQPNHAGTYVCEEASSRSSAEFNLVVLGR